MFHGSTRRDVIRRDSARAEDEQERGHRTRVARFCGLATIIIGVTIATVTNGVRSCIERSKEGCHFFSISLAGSTEYTGNIGRDRVLIRIALCRVGWNRAYSGNSIRKYTAYRMI